MKKHTYRVSFEYLGRGAPPADLVIENADLDMVLTKVHKLAKQRLTSRGIETEVFDNQVRVYAGFQVVGRGTVKKVEG